jgi:hypothetical protein
MIGLPAGLHFQRFSQRFSQRFPRMAVYAMLAALVTTVLFAAEGAYRWYSDAGATVATAPVPIRDVKAPEPAPAATSPAPALETSAKAPEPATQPVTTPTVPVRTFAVPAEPAPAALTAAPAQIRTAAPETAGIETKPDVRSADAPVANPIRAPARPTIAPRQRAQKAAPQRKRQEARRLPAKQPAVQARASAQKRTPAPKPNVYYERDSQLGFAPQLRKRTCNPASGQMPMQCYYPREGRERFPAKAGNP